METELKLAFSSEAEMLALLEESWFNKILIPNSQKTENFDSYYLDTADQVLRGLFTSIRIRSGGEQGFLQTVKIGTTNRDGLHQRLEWNLESEEETFDPEYFLFHAISDGDPKDRLKTVLEAVEGKDLLMICRTNFLRTASLAGYGDSLMEIALDRGYLYAKDQEEYFCELEIELKEGDVRDVLALGEDIIAHTGATRDSRGKYSRCLALIDKA